MQTTINVRPFTTEDFYGLAACAESFDDETPPLIREIEGENYFAVGDANGISVYFANDEGEYYGYGYYLELPHVTEKAARTILALLPSELHPTYLRLLGFVTA